MSAGDEAGELASLAYHTGIVMGSLHRPQTQLILVERGVDGKQIETVLEALRHLTKAFYRTD